MPDFHPERLRLLAQIGIGAVWVFHGLYSKILNGIPRHRLIVGKILGAERAGIATKTIGLLELLLGAWAVAGWHPGVVRLGANGGDYCDELIGDSASA